MFPAQTGCSRCTGTDVETVELPATGSLWTWTVQNFPPKSPPLILVRSILLSPTALAYVDLGGLVCIESRLTEADPAKLETGMGMRLQIETLAVDDEGTEVVTFAFAPATDLKEPARQ